MKTADQPRRRVLLFLNQDEKCHWCGRRTRLCNNAVPDQATIDHVIPRGRGGSNTLDNCVCACRGCNQERNRRDLLSWRKGPASKASTGEDLLAALVEVSRQRDAAVRQLNAHRSWKEEHLGSAIHECGPGCSRERGDQAGRGACKAAATMPGTWITTVPHLGFLDKKIAARNRAISAHRKELMSEIRISLGHPALIFVYSLALLLVGCCIGMHIHNSRAAIWMSLAAAALVVVHDLLTAFLFSLLTLRRFRREQNQSSPR